MGGVQQTGKKFQIKKKRRRRHTENVEDKVLGYMTGTGESLTDAQSHGHTHMEAGGATLGFTVL